MDRSSRLFNILGDNETGVIEGNYKSNLSMFELGQTKSEKDTQFTCELSAMDGAHLGTHTLLLKKMGDNDQHSECWIVSDDHSGTPVNPEELDRGAKVIVVLNPFPHNMKGFAGRFVAEVVGTF